MELLLTFLIGLVVGFVARGPATDVRWKWKFEKARSDAEHYEDLWNSRDVDNPSQAQN